MRCSLVVAAALALLPTNTLGEPCKTGCRVTTHDIPVLDDATISTLVEDLAEETRPGSDSVALETLLFHADSLRRYVGTHGAAALGRHRELLVHELTITHAIMQVRVVDEAGLLRAQFAPTRVPLGHKTHHFATQTHRLPGLEVSGTVIRVGLEHVWSRL
jgi:hypothetical protein